MGTSLLLSNPQEPYIPSAQALTGPVKHDVKHMAVLTHAEDAAQRLRRLWLPAATQVTTPSPSPSGAQTTSAAAHALRAPDVGGEVPSNTLGNVRCTPMATALYGLAIDGEAAATCKDIHRWRLDIIAGVSHLGLRAPLDVLAKAAQRRPHCEPNPSLHAVWHERLGPLPASLPRPSPEPSPQRGSATTPGQRAAARESLQALLEDEAVATLLDSSQHEPTSGYGTARLVAGQLLAGLAECLPDAPGLAALLVEDPSLEGSILQDALLELTDLAQALCVARYREEFQLALQLLVHELTGLLGLAHPYSANHFERMAGAAFGEQSPGLASKLADGTLQLSAVPTTSGMDAVASALMAATDVMPNARFRRCGWQYFEIDALIRRRPVRSAGKDDGTTVKPHHAEVLFVALNTSTGGPHDLPAIIAEARANIEAAQAAGHRRLLLLDTTVLGPWGLNDAIAPLLDLIAAGNLAVLVAESNAKQATLGLGAAMTGTLALVRAQDCNPALEAAFGNRTAPEDNMTRAEAQLVTHILTYAPRTKERLTTLAAANAAMMAEHLPAQGDERPYVPGSIFLQRNGASFAALKQRGFPHRDSFGFPDGNCTVTSKKHGTHRLSAGWLTPKSHGVVGTFGWGQARRKRAQAAAGGSEVPKIDPFSPAYVRAVALQVLNQALVALDVRPDPKLKASAPTDEMPDETPGERTDERTDATVQDPCQPSFDALATAMRQKPGEVQKLMVIPKIASLLQEAELAGGADGDALLSPLAYHLLKAAGPQGRSWLPQQTLITVLQISNAGGGMTIPWPKQDFDNLMKGVLPTHFHADEDDA